MSEYDARRSALTQYDWRAAMRTVILGKLHSVARFNALSVADCYQHGLHSARAVHNRRTSGPSHLLSYRRCPGLQPLYRIQNAMPGRGRGQSFFGQLERPPRAWHRQCSASPSPSPPAISRARASSCLVYRSQVPNRQFRPLVRRDHSVVPLRSPQKQVERHQGLRSRIGGLQQPGKQHLAIDGRGSA